jgi:hypothetical protein
MQHICVYSALCRTAQNKNKNLRQQNSAHRAESKSPIDEKIHPILFGLKQQFNKNLSEVKMPTYDDLKRGPLKPRLNIVKFWF